MPALYRFKGSGPVPAQFIQQERLELVQWIAFFAMVIDHAAIMMAPDVPWMRMISRIAFPMFCFVFAWRLAYATDQDQSRSLFPTTWKLIVSGCASQAIWILFGQPEPLNVLFVFLTALVVIGLMEESYPFLDIPAPFRWAAATLLLFMMGPHVDFGYFGLVLILGTYGFFRWGSIESLVLGIISYLALDYLSFTKGTLLAGVVVLLVLKSPFCVSKKIPNFFYWAYPIHLIALAAIAILLTALKVLPL